ncbi:MAG: Ig-like domain-containing protein, partial [Gemmatimonadaceae bacterium]|nr:Ig-like domain-containing protein [Gemmatimonadaceae bacterium]
MRNNSLAGALFALSAFAYGCTENATRDPASPSLHIYKSNVAVSPASLSVVAGATAQVTAAFKDRKGRVVSGAVFAWSSSRADIATISRNGLVTGVAAGTVAITARYGYNFATSQVTVGARPAVPTAPSTPPVTSLILVPNVLNVAAGASQQFSVSGRTAADSSTPVAVTVAWTATGGTISPSGLFTAGTVAGASYNVTATILDNPAVAAKAKVTVTTVAAPPTPAPPTPTPPTPTPPTPTPPTPTPPTPAPP